MQPAAKPTISLWGIRSQWALSRTLSIQRLCPPVGYANDIFNKLSQENSNLQLKELGCIGETTTSMIQGGNCNYGADASQLKAAIDFLEHNRVSLITLDIGANDIDTCISTSGVSDSCVS